MKRLNRHSNFFLTQSLSLLPRFGLRLGLLFGLLLGLLGCSGYGVKESNSYQGYEEEPPPKGCAGPAGFIAEGASATMYRESQPSLDSHCESETRICINGILTGTYTSVMCNEPQPLPTIDVSPLVPAPPVEINAESKSAPKKKSTTEKSAED